jgi:hypothetical protein
MSLDDDRSVPAHDQLAIMQVLYQYCRGVDRMDRALTLGCFAAPARLTYSDNYVGDPAGFVALLWPAHEAMLNHVHTIGNVVFASAGADRAVTEAQVRVTLRFENDGTTVDLIGLGRYLDRWERRGTRWLITDRTYVSDMTNVQPVGAPDVDHQLRRAPDARRIGGTRDRSDPSYPLLDGPSGVTRNPTAD